MAKQEVIRFRCTEEFKVDIEGMAERRKVSISELLCTVLENELDSKENLTGRRWSALSEEQQDRLLLGANCIDGRTGNTTHDGDCIVDFENGLSISGSVKDGEITIQGTAKLYNAAE